MRMILASFVLTLILLAPSEARAQFPVYSYGPYYYPPVYRFPSYTAPYSSPYVAPYSPPYIWSGRYYTNPFSSGYRYQQYSPYTNQYYYQYRVAPNFWWY